MNFTQISHPTVTAAKDEFLIRKIMRDSRLEKLPIEKITLAPQYPLGVYEDFMLEDLTENIRVNGILTPILVCEKLVCEKVYMYEVIDGAARYEAAKILGETELPATIVTCSADEAVMIAFECNLCRRSIKDLKLSIQAKIISDYYYSLKDQGRRSDLIYRAAHGEERMMYELDEEYNRARGKKVNKFLRRFANKYERYDVRREVMERYGVSGANISRFLRINQLYGGLKEYMDAGEIGFIAAVQLSFLTGEMQELVAECIKEGAKITVKNAGKIKQTATHMRQRGENPAPARLREIVRRIFFGAETDPLKPRQFKSKSKPKMENFSPLDAALGDYPNSPYKGINDYEKYLKARFPNYFQEDASGMEQENIFIRTLIFFYVTLSDTMCLYFSQFFNPLLDYANMIDGFTSGVIRYYSGLADGTIQPPEMS